MMLKKWKQGDLEEGPERMEAKTTREGTGAERVLIIRIRVSRGFP